MCLEPSVALGLEGNDEEIKGQNDCDQAKVTWQFSWFPFRDFPLVQVGKLTFWVRGPWGRKELSLDSSSAISEMCDRGQLNFSLYLSFLFRKMGKIMLIS